MEVEPKIYSIPIETIKGTEKYSYTGNDTVQDLKQKICDNEGIPVDIQRLHVKYGMRNGWKIVDITKSQDLLILYASTAVTIKLSINLNKM